jgi:hypothetical protein
MEDLEQYLEEIIEPTIADFANNPASRRHAFLACVATFHGVDYLAHPRRPAPLRQKWQQRSEAFRIVDRVAHAFKHVVSGSPSNPRNAHLQAKDVVSVRGAFQANAFSSAFQIASVRLASDPTVDILRSVQEAAQFLREELVDQV